MEVVIKQNGNVVWEIETKPSCIEVYIDGYLYMKHSKEV
jgi:hypothetical protein